jgi:hypothetical protein
MYYFLYKQLPILLYSPDENTYTTKIMRLLTILLLCIAPIFYSLHLSSIQITAISKLIQHPKMTTYHRTHLNTILYRAYEKWAVSKAVAFGSFHKQKCTNIATEELVFASKIGLFKAIQNYNGKSDLSIYSNIYVQSELLRLVTDTYSMSILPKSIRRQKKTGMDIDTQLYKHLLTVRPFSMYEPWKIELMGALRDKYVDNVVDTYETTETIREYLDKQPLFVKRMFLLYMNYWSGTNRPPSQKYLAEMMCCSEETVRQNVQRNTQYK